MISVSHVRRGLSIVAFLLAAVCADAQTAQGTQKPFEPTSGQAGKDVVWVPTPQGTVDNMGSSVNRR